MALLLEAAEEELLAFTAFSLEHLPKLRSTNPLERLNKEIARRGDVVGIYPNDAGLIRLAGALLLEQNDEWLVGRRCSRPDDPDDDQELRHVKRLDRTNPRGHPRLAGSRLRDRPRSQIMGSCETPDRARIKQEVAGVFGRAAPTYDRVGPRFFSHFGYRLVELARIPSGANVLDVATGRGAVLLPAAIAVGPRGHVTGIDLSEAMVGEVAEEIGRLGQGNVRVCQMDAEDLQLPDESFDCVLCGFAIFFFPQLERALAEMRRVLRPGGRIALTTWDRSFDEQWEWFHELVKAQLPPRPETRQPPESRPPLSPELNKPEGLRGVMTAAGFTGVHVVSEAAEFAYPSVEVWWSSLWSHGIREELEAVEEAVGSEGLERLKAAACERIRTVMRADGIHQLFPVLATLAIKPQSDTDAP